MSRDTQDTLLKQLKNPFDSKFVKWRVGATSKDKTSGIALAYIDSREVMKRLDEVVGVGNWQSKITHFPNGFVCEISLLIDGQWITKSNVAGYTHVEPEKGGASDAFKRAASMWGVGRYLYYLPNIWVAIKPLGNSYVLAEQPELPDWAKPENNIAKWEDVAELELDMTASFDEQEFAAVIITNLDLVRNAKSVKELTKIMENLNPEEQAVLSSEIDKKTKELLKDDKPRKTNTS